MSLIFHSLHCPVSNNEGNAYNDVPSSVEITDISTFPMPVTCLNGHNHFVYTTMPDYAYFLNHAIDAYNGKNYIESFSSFYTTLELFRKFIVSSHSSVILNQPIDLSKSNSIIDSSLQKRLDKQGSIRNKVIHSGKIPNKTEVEDVGLTIYQYIKRIEMKYFTSPVKPVTNIVTRFMLNKQIHFDSTLPAKTNKNLYSQQSELFLIGRIDILTPLNRYNFTHEQLTFDGLVNDKKRQNQYYK